LHKTGSIGVGELEEPFISLGLAKSPEEVNIYLDSRIN